MPTGHLLRHAATIAERRAVTTAARQHGATRHTTAEVLRGALHTAAAARPEAAAEAAAPVAVEAEVLVAAVEAVADKFCRFTPAEQNRSNHKIMLSEPGNYVSQTTKLCFPNRESMFS